MRIDKWLVFARFFKTRAKVTKAIEKNLIFLNGSLLKRQAQSIKLEDDILIKNSNNLIRIIVKKFAEKREGYEKASLLYEKKDSIINSLLSDKILKNESIQNSPRPNKKDRRALTQLKKYGHYY